MGVNQKDSSFDFNSYCTSVQIKRSQCVQQIPPAACIFFFSPKNPFALVCSFSIAECCSSLCPSQSVAELKFKGMWSSCLRKETKSIYNLKKGQITQTCSLSLPISNRDPCMLESLPHNCKNVCQYWVGRANLTALYIDVRECVVQQIPFH